MGLGDCCRPTKQKGQGRGSWYLDERCSMVCTLPIQTHHPSQPTPVPADSLLRGRESHLHD
jgi:hypothetical protein